MLLQQLVNGLMLGSTYSLIAIGYALIFGVLGLVHLAHGEVFMMGALIGLQIVLWMKAGPVVALVGALLGTAVLGILIELIAFRPIRARNGPIFAPMVSTIGVGLILQEVATKAFGGEQVGFPHFSKKGQDSESFRLRNKISPSGRSSIRLGEHGPRSLTLPVIGPVAVREDTRRLRRILAGPPCTV